MQTALSLKPSNPKATEEREAARHKSVKNENQPLKERNLKRQNSTSNLHRYFIPIKRVYKQPLIESVSKEEFEVYEDPDPVENVPKKVAEKENVENDENKKDVIETQSEKDNNVLHELEEKRQKEEQKKMFMLTRDNNDVTLGCSKPSSKTVTMLASCDDDDYNKISVAFSTFTTAIRASSSNAQVDVETSIEEENKISVMRKKAEKECRDDLMDVSEEYYLDNLKYMISQQAKHRPSSTSFSRQKHLSEKMRSILVDWLGDVVEGYDLQKETFHLAVNLLDRVFLSLDVEKTLFQLVGTTCMMIAAKYEEIYPPAIDKFAYITKYKYTVPDILSMERFILAKFRFSIFVPTASWFGTCFAKRMQFTPEMSETMEYLLDLSLMDACFLRYRPSDIGAAAICFTNIQHEKEAWPEKMIEETGLKTDTFLYVLKDLHEMYIYASTSCYKSIFDRYSRIDKARVALLPAPSDNLKKLFPTYFGVAL